MKNISRTAAALAAASMLAVVPSTSAHALEWQPITGHGSMVLATCADGSEVMSADLSDPRRNRFAEQPVFDADGNMTGMVLFLRYAGSFTHSTSEAEIWGSGVDRIFFDFTDGTATETGNRWTVAIQGEGWVVKEAGRITYSLADGALIDLSGVDGGGWDKLCPFFGVAG